MPAVTEVCRTAARALPQPLPDRPSRAVSAARTAESFRPAQLEQIIPTSLLRRKAGLELSQVPRIVLHRTAYYILGLPESSKYPILRNLWIDRFSIVGPRHPAPETDPAPSHPSVPIRGTSVALQFYYSLAANPVLAAHLQERLFPALSITYVSGIAQAPTAESWCRAGITKLPRVPDRSTGFRENEPL